MEGGFVKRRLSAIAAKWPAQLLVPLVPIPAFREQSSPLLARRANWAGKQLCHFLSLLACPHPDKGRIQ